MLFGIAQLNVVCWRPLPNAKRNCLWRIRCQRSLGKYIMQYGGGAVLAGENHGGPVYLGMKRDRTSAGYCCCFSCCCWIQRQRRQMRRRASRLSAGYCCCWRQHRQQRSKLWLYWRWQRRWDDRDWPHSVRRSAFIRSLRPDAVTSVDQVDSG